jgi:dephospho-CoA kinase
MNKVVAVVGMAGSGKSEVSRVFEEAGFVRVRFGDITEEEIQRRGLPLNEENERKIREELREKYGMAAYARLNLPRIDAARAKASVVADGLYSWEENILLKDYYKGDFCVVAVYASPATRYARLASRSRRRLTLEEAASRDNSEIVNLNKGGPIAMADHTIINEAPIEELRESARAVIERLKCRT